jgi:large subunit ribosomal protein L2
MKRYKPTSPGRRTYETTDKSDLTDEDPVESLTESLNKTGGRNNTGRITVRGQGGGNKNRYRKIDFKRNKDGVPGTVVRLEYDPNRSARIALVQYEDGEKRYILAPRDLEVDDTVQSGHEAPIRPGNALPLEEIPVGSFIHNVELNPGAGGKLCRSAGNFAQLASKDEGYALIDLPSDQGRRVTLSCRATIGRVGNVEHINRVRGKAGQSRYENKRPITRGMARNPVDHPLGGGEGRIKGGHPQAPGGGLTLGEKTRANKRTDKFVVRNIRE